MRVLVYGGRDYQDQAAMFEALDRVGKLSPPGTMVVIQGGAAGADALARDWARSRMVTYINYTADWAKHGRAAGPIRNQRMIDEGRPDIALEFPGGRGTADMRRRVEMAGIKTLKPSS